MTWSTPPLLREWGASPVPREGCRALLFRGDFNPNAPQRQETYLRVLRSLPNAEVIYGHFLTNEVHRPRADGNGWVRVIKTEEKGSDVNLATHLVADAFRHEFEAAVLITNDSDLCAPIDVVTQELGLPVGILMPVAREGRRPSRELMKAATFWKPIRTGAVRASQFPDEIDIEGQTLFRPDRWK